MDISFRTEDIADDTDHAFRGLMHRDWWKPIEGRVSSAAFHITKKEKISVDLESLTSAEDSFARLRATKPGCGLCRFNCGVGRDLGFVTVKEIDPNFRENKAHASVYLPKKASVLRRNARILANKSVLVFPPEFPPDPSN